MRGKRRTMINRVRKKNRMKKQLQLQLEEGSSKNERRERIK